LGWTACGISQSLEDDIQYSLRCGDAPVAELYINNRLASSAILPIRAVGKNGVGARPRNNDDGLGERYRPALPSGDVANRV
jgi:hypothetical protein